LEEIAQVLGIWVISRKPGNVFITWGVDPSAELSEYKVGTVVALKLKNRSWAGGRKTK